MTSNSNINLLPVLDHARQPKGNGGILRALRQRMQEKRDYTHLASLPDYLLEDVGIIRGEIGEILRDRRRSEHPGPRSEVARPVHDEPTKGAPVRFTRASTDIRSLRINLLRLTGIGGLIVCLFTRPILSLADWQLVLIDLAGAALIILAVFGRLWAMLHIGGRKSSEVVRTGPYAMCRHPLYLFSLAGILGFCVMESSVVIGAVISLTALAIFLLTAHAEERFLTGRFAMDYKRYAEETPMLLPRPPASLPRIKELLVNTDPMRRNIRDALVFLLTIPLSELLEAIDEAGLLPALEIL